MSRIDEALRQFQGKSSRAENTPADRSQHQFIPAWTVNDGRAGNGGPGYDPEEIASPQVSNRVSPGEVSLRFASEWRDRLALAPDGDPALIEQFRRLAATLHHAHLNNGLRSVMVTSAMPDDGKTLTSINLALVLAESYRYNVLLIDADLRRPSIPSVVDLGAGIGLTEALRAPTEQKLALVTLTPRLTLLPAGHAIANSIEALTSPRMRQILAEAAGRFDWVILDAPPVGPTADARLLTQMVGGTLFVIRAAKTPYADVQKALDAIGREQILGVVLNDVDAGTVGRHDYGAGPAEGKD